MSSFIVKFQMKLFYFLNFFCWKFVFYSFFLFKDLTVFYLFL